MDLLRRENVGEWKGIYRERSRRDRTGRVETVVETEQEDERDEHGENDETEHRNYEPFPPPFRRDAVRRKRAHTTTTALHQFSVFVFFFCCFLPLFFSLTLWGDNIPLYVCVFLSFPLTLLHAFYYFFLFEIFVSLLDSRDNYFILFKMIFGVF